MTHQAAVVDEVRRAIQDHFQRSVDHIGLTEVMEMTALDEANAENALAVLHNLKELDGVTVLQKAYPVRITGYRFPAQ